MADSLLLQQLLEHYAATKSLPLVDELFNRMDGAVAALEHVRGGIRDFTRQAPRPLIVVPDLHGRRDFFLSLLLWHLPEPFRQTGADRLPDESVLQLLAAGRIRIVCVGDLFHSESRGKVRWQASYKAYLHGNAVSEAMTEEMCENLSLLQMVALLQLAFSDDFVFLKGNHENILNRTGGGDFAFRKFAEEGEQVHAFMDKVYGPQLVRRIFDWEQLLPLCALTDNCVVTHGEPLHAFSREAIECMEGSVIAGLTWTRNDEADEGSVIQTMQSLYADERWKTAVWIAGHRPVSDLYALRQGGAFVQIHNPWNEQVAVVLPDRPFNPETDICQLREEV